jgi:RNA polymerase sigma factor for flagellar operon FliA
MSVQECSVRDRMVMDHVPLLRHIVGRMSLPRGIDRDDVLGWGMLGLISAAEGFDSSRGMAFSTYAYSRIRGAILDELRRADALPRGQREALRAVERTTAELTQELGSPPTPEAIAERAGISTESVEEILALARAAIELSLEDDTHSVNLSALLSDPRSDDPVASAQWQEMKELLASAIRKLPEPERTVILLYYGEEMLLRDIGDVLGVTESRVSQIHSAAIYRLNRELALAHGGHPR